MALDPAALAVEGFTSIATSLIQKRSEKEQKELEAYIARLNDDQKRAIEDAMLKKQTEMERQAVLFQAMAVSRNEELMKKTAFTRNVSIAVVAAGFILLVSLIIISKKNEKQPT